MTSRNYEFFNNKLQHIEKYDQKRIFESRFQPAIEYLQKTFGNYWGTIGSPPNRSVTAP